MIAYHGTNKLAVKSILETGFRVGTYFAICREDAVFFGGPFVFAVRFSDDPSMWHGDDDPSEGWQFHVRERIPVSGIVEFPYLEEE